MTTSTAQMPAPLTASELKRKWSIYTPGELKQRCEDLDCGASLIAGLIPQRSLRIVVGDSGLGKSPLLYQAALCVTTGVPFLGRSVSKGRVLYLDFENGLGDVDELVGRLSRHLGLAEKPENLLLWNFNDAPPKWEPTQLGCMIRDAKPVWAIIDSLGALAPDIEEKGQQRDTGLSGISGENSRRNIHHWSASSPQTLQQTGRSAAAVAGRSPPMVSASSRIAGFD